MRSLPKRYWGGYSANFALGNRVLGNVSRETSTIVDKYYYIYEDLVKIVYLIFTMGYGLFAASSTNSIHNPSTIF